MQTNMRSVFKKPVASTAAITGPANISNFLGTPKAPAPTVAPGTVPASSSGSSFMSRIAGRMKAALPPIAPPVAAPAPAAAPALTPQQAQAAMVPGLDNRALDALHKYSLSEGPSPWLKMAEEKQKLDEANQLDLTAKQSAGSQAQAMDAIAMRGGLRGGSAENLARQSMENTMLGQQGVRSQGATQRLGLGMDDENRKMSILQNLPGQNLNVWNAGMQVQGANAMADAIRNQGSVGSPLGIGDPGQSVVNKLPGGPVKEAGNIWNKMTTFNPVLDPTGGAISAYNAIKTVKTPSWLGG